MTMVLVRSRKRGVELEARGMEGAEGDCDGRTARGGVALAMGDMCAPIARIGTGGSAPCWGSA